MKDVLKSVVFYAPYSKQGFSAIVRGTDGKPVPLKDNQGNQKYYKGKPQWQTRYLEFHTQIASRTNAAEPLSFYRVNFYAKTDENGLPILDEKKEPIAVPEDVDIFEALEKLADDPGTKIEREEAYKKKANPEAFEKETELKLAKAELAKMKKDGTKKEAVIAEMLRDNEKLKAEINAAKSPKK